LTKKISYDNILLAPEHRKEVAKVEEPLIFLENGKFEGYQGTFDYILLTIRTGQYSVKSFCEEIAALVLEIKGQEKYYSPKILVNFEDGAPSWAIALTISILQKELQKYGVEFHSYDIAIANKEEGIYYYAEGDTKNGGGYYLTGEPYIARTPLKIITSSR
jgi:hypothetical protein